MKRRLRKRIQKIKFLAMDCDGVLTDGSMWGDNKGFNVRDGIGIIDLQLAGIKTAIISGDTSPCIYERAKQLRINKCLTGIQNKEKAISEIFLQYNIGYSEIAYIGDDTNDGGAMKMVGLPVAVMDATTEIKKIAVYTTKAKGGHGAVREVCDLILKVKNKIKT